MILDTSDRMYCWECVPGFKAERTQKLYEAGRRELARMRASAHDSAQSAEAKAKRAATLNARRRAVRAWESSNPGPHNPEVFRQEILPSRVRMTGPEIMKATGRRLAGGPVRSGLGSFDR